ncbi:MAG: hypothetical protein AVDCRST_MAG50-2437, partial [uncultured Acidimicrobiales bacterium]
GTTAERRPGRGRLPARGALRAGGPERVGHRAHPERRPLRRRRLAGAAGARVGVPAPRRPARRHGHGAARIRPVGRRRAGRGGDAACRSRRHPGPRSGGRTPRRPPGEPDDRPAGRALGVVLPCCGGRDPRRGRDEPRCGHPAPVDAARGSVRRGPVERLVDPVRRQRLPGHPAVRDRAGDPPGRPARVHGRRAPRRWRRAVEPPAAAGRRHPSAALGPPGFL